MHDIRALRDDPAAYVRGWSSRGVADAQAQVDAILDLDARLRAAQTAVQAAQAERNDASKQIGQAKAKKDEAEAARLMAHVETLKKTLEEQGELERRLKEELLGTGGVLASLPNLPAEDVPAGADEDENVELRRYGEPFAIASPKDHVDLGEGLAMLDFEAAGRMSGSRFVVLKKDLARLERALGQFMLDMQTLEHGYTEVSPPLLVRDEAMFGTGQLPKFEDDLFFAASTYLPNEPGTAAAAGLYQRRVRHPAPGPCDLPGPGPVAGRQPGGGAEQRCLGPPPGQRPGPPAEQ